MQTSRRTLWLSDIHLGTSVARTADLLRFLDAVSADVIDLTGDIVDLDGVVCGHIHRPAIRHIAGVCYANDGDWVEHRTALAEAADGSLELLSWASESVAVEPPPFPKPASLAA